MTRQALADAITQALLDTAPDIDPAALTPDIDLRQELDIDSMDYLNFIIRLHERFGVDLPEAEYPRLRTLAGCIDTLAAKLGIAH